MQLRYKNIDLFLFYLIIVKKPYKKASIFFLKNVTMNLELGYKNI
jgi:hypothetical protein